jgi:hypothetical protein
VHFVGEEVVGQGHVLEGKSDAFGLEVDGLHHAAESSVGLFGVGACMGGRVHWKSRKASMCSSP